MRITYIGHATLLLEFEGTRILTDPNFDERLGWLLRRVSAPGVPLDQLPKLDAILVTHAHADHLSFRSLALLPHDVPLFAPPTLARWLTRLGHTQAVPVAPGEQVTVGAVTVRAAQATHMGARYGVDRWRGQANMYLLATPDRTAFFAGDTALMPETTHLVEHALHAYDRRLDVALLPIGHAPWWKPGFRRGHLTSADALELFQRLGARYLVPYHWGTFNHVTSTAYDAIVRLRAMIEAHHRGADVRILEPGSTLEVLGEDEAPYEPPDVLTPPLRDVVNIPPPPHSPPPNA